MLAGPYLLEGVDTGLDLHSVVREVDEELGEATLGRCVVTKDGRESGVLEGPGKASPERLSAAAVVA